MTAHWEPTDAEAGRILNEAMADQNWADWSPQTRKALVHALSVGHRHGYEAAQRESYEQAGSMLSSAKAALGMQILWNDSPSFDAARRESEQRGYERRVAEERAERERWRQEASRPGTDSCVDIGDGLRVLLADTPVIQNVTFMPGVRVVWPPQPGGQTRIEVDPDWPADVAFTTPNGTAVYQRACKPLSTGPRGVVDYGQYASGDDYVEFKGPVLDETSRITVVPPDPNKEEPEYGRVLAGGTVAFTLPTPGEVALKEAEERGAKRERERIVAVLRQAAQDNYASASEWSDKGDDDLAGLHGAYGNAASTMASGLAREGG